MAKNGGRPHSVAAAAAAGGPWICAVVFGFVQEAFSRVTGVGEIAVDFDDRLTQAFCGSSHTTGGRSVQFWAHVFL